MGKFVYRNEACMEKMYAFYDRSLASLHIDYSEETIQTSFGKTHIVFAGDRARYVRCLFLQRRDDAVAGKGPSRTNFQSRLAGPVGNRTRTDAPNPFEYGHPIYEILLSPRSKSTSGDHGHHGVGRGRPVARVFRCDDDLL